MATIWNYEENGINFTHGLDRHPRPEDYTMHAHEMHELYVFMGGIGTYMVEGHEYPLEPGAIMLMRAGEAHKLQIRPDKPYERIALHMQPRLLAGVDPAGLLFEPFTDRPLGCGNHYERGCLPTGRFYEYIRGMMPENGDAYIRRLAILTYLCPLMTELREVFLARRREENGAVPRQNAGQALVAYINSNLAGDLSLDALSDRFYLSKSQLGRLFKQATGSSIWEYVLIKRLLNARQRIRDGEPAGEVCQSSGFRDYSAFFRAYKKRFGLSPQEDRGRGRAG